ncbi:MAG TPA: pyridoxamine 5'-phosphate oxidase family protein [Acidimicrobiales bacterium]|nr:pyridoxamine 5'-phosphate oxidase family protein [Acidimicrobiales bacterium]
MVREQRRGRRIAMDRTELDAFLREERTCRLGTVSVAGHPHVTPLWFAWDGTSVWINSIVKSQRWTDLQRDPRVSIMVDAGREYGELRGVELIGSVVQVGEAPRTAAPNPELAEPERLYAQKYQGGGDFHPDGRHAWLRMTPDKVVSWDFRKLGA